MKELGLSVQEIRELMEAFRKSGLGSFKIQQGDFSFELKSRKIEGAALSTEMPLPVPDSGPVREAEPESPREYSGNVVSSPIVGTFYAAPAPDKKPYVEVGSRVRKGDVLFIIESMKLMNEVTSELDGTVAEILVENAQGVEYGQPILVIQ